MSNLRKDAVLKVSKTCQIMALKNGRSSNKIS